ncbi:MAG: hypothetical protein AB7U48_06470, partial [Bauldia sp.]
MAEYYALLARAVGRLQPSTETARRDIYAKARNALIQQLKGISPPLSAAEISKQRLELEEAIRKIEREAAAPPQATATEAEISRSAARAMEEALGPIGDPPPAAPRAAETTRAPEPPRGVPPPPPRAAAPVVEAVRVAPEPVRVEPVAPRAPAPPTPAEVRLRAVPAEAADDEAFTVVSPTPLPPTSAGQPRPAMRAAPRPAAPQARGANWDERATAAAFNDDAATGEGRRGRRLSRAERRAERQAERQRPQRSVLSRLLLLVLILLVIGAAGYAAYAYREELQDFFASLTDGGEPATDPAAATVDAGGAATPVEGGGAAPPTDVRIVGPQPVDAGVGPPNAGAAAAPAPAEILPTQAILYERVGDGDLPAFEGTIDWAFVPDGPNGPRLDAVINVPERGLTVQLSIERAPEAATQISHTIEVVVVVPPDFPGGGIREVAQLAAKSSEDAIGTPIVAASQSLPPDYFLFELAAESERQNMSQLRQDWFDLGFTYADGQQAIITFNKGTDG